MKIRTDLSAVKVCTAFKEKLFFTFSKLFTLVQVLEEPRRPDVILGGKETKNTWMTDLQSS